MTYWHEDEIKYAIDACVSGVTAKEIANHLNRTAPSVRGMLFSKGIKSGNVIVKTPEERFNYYIDKTSKPSCWLWTGSNDGRGYGQLRVNNKLVIATHFSLKMSGITILKGQYVCHHCDTPACVNPEHLFVGTPSENIQDCIKKGRFSPPPRSGVIASAISRSKKAQEKCGPDHMIGVNLYLWRGEKMCRACRSRQKQQWKNRRNLSCQIGIQTRDTS